MDIVIRNAVLQDYDDLCRLFDQVDTIHCEQFPAIYRKAAGPIRSIEEIQSILEDGQQCIMAACEQGKVIGLLHGFIRDTPVHPMLVMRTFAKIDSMGVDQAYKRQGVGHKLIEHFQAWAKSRGATSLELNVYHFNREAVRFYQQEGFEDVRQLMRKAIP